MRFLLFSAFLGGWIFMWWWTYVYHIKACPVADPQISDFKVDTTAPLPLSFRWSDPIPIVSGDFERWRDSIASSINQDQILEVTGISYRDESDAATQSTLLGRQRARAIAILFASRLPKDKIVERSGIGEITADIRKKSFPGYLIRPCFWNDVVRESSDCTFIYFPDDSTKHRGDDALIEYMKSLQSAMANSDQSLQLCAFAESRPKSQVSLDLNSWRLVAFERKLTAQGISEARIRFRAGNESELDQCIPDDLRSSIQDWLVLKPIK